MADGTARADKLAAARKKLKQYQGKSPKTSATALKLSNNDSDCVPTKQSKVEPNNGLAINQRSQEDSRFDKESSFVRSTSSTENLRQITMQLNGLVSETHDISDYVSSNPSVSTLEKRNQELASLLETHMLSNEKLREEVQDLKQRLIDMDSHVKMEKEEGDDRRLRDLTSLRGQLQVHIQTIGILVAEKTELQSSLVQSQQTAKQKAGEVEELQGRLKASRQRVIDLEREVATLAVSSQQQEKINKENLKEIDRLRMDIYKVTKTKEELQEHVSELLEKLNVKLAEAEGSQLKIEHLEKELVMVNMRIKQLSGNETLSEYPEELDDLKQKNVDLEMELGNMRDVLSRLTEEKNQANIIYQKHTMNANQQMQTLTDKVTSLMTEKINLENSNAVLLQQLSTLKDQLDANEKIVKADSYSDDLLETLQNKLAALQEREVEFSQQQQSLVNDNSQLMVLVSEKERQIEHLEFSLAEAQEFRTNNGRLLESIESDKLAASRAMTQNKELKKQLEELEDGFVQMSNDKLALTEKMMTEQHICKELGERLTQQEDEIKELKEQLTDKEHRLSLVHKSSTELTMQMYQQHQIADRMRHFEAQGQLTEILQQELNQAQERISALSTQNSELRTILANQTAKLIKPVEDETDAEATYDKEMSRKDEIVLSLSASVRQLELERNQLLGQLEERSQQQGQIKTQLMELQMSALNNLDNDRVLQNGDDHKDSPLSDGDSSLVSAEEYHKLKQTMAVLEKRFTRTMQEISDMADQKQELEHKVTQLQGETETISDYISLYQMQRHVMKQQVAKKDEYIASVCRDREELKEKLAKLQELVCKLLFERPEKDVSMKKVSKVLDKAMLDSIGDKGLNYRPTVNDMLDCLSHLSPRNKQVENGETHAEIAEFPKADGGRGIPPELNSVKTAQKIISLISEIGATNLMEKSVSDNFHPCPVCSGSLQTV